MRKSTVLLSFVALICLFTGARNAAAQIPCSALPYAPVTAPTQADSNFSALYNCIVNGRSAPHTSTLATLQTLSTVNYPNGVWRDAYSASAPAWPVFYTPSGSVCSLNAGAGDGGSQVSSADGKCWLANFIGLADIREWGAVCGTGDYTTQLQAAINWAETASVNAGLYMPAACTIQHASPLVATGAFTLRGGGMMSAPGSAIPLGDLSHASVIQFTGAAATTTLSSNYSTGSTTMAVASCSIFSTGDTIVVGPDAGSNYYYMQLGSSPCSGTTLTIPSALFQATVAAVSSSTTLPIKSLSGTGFVMVTPGPVLSGTGISGSPTITGWIVNSGGTGDGSTGTYTMSGSQTISANTIITGKIPSLTAPVTITDISASPIQLKIEAATSGQVLAGGEISNVVFDGDFGASISVQANSLSNWKFDFAAIRDLYFGWVLSDGNAALSLDNRIAAYSYDVGGGPVAYSSGGVYFNGCATGHGVTEHTPVGQIDSVSYGSNGTVLCNVDAFNFAGVQGNIRFTSNGSGEYARNNRVAFLSGKARLDQYTIGNIIVDANEEQTGTGNTCGDAAWGDATALLTNTWWTGAQPANDATGRLTKCGQMDAKQTLTFSQLPASPSLGQEYWISDGKAANCGDSTCTTFGTAVTGGSGALTLKIEYNGSGWTLAGL